MPAGGMSEGKSRSTAGKPVTLGAAPQTPGYAAVVCPASLD